MNDDKLKYDVEYRKSNESLVKEYFKTIRSKDLHRLLKLFSDDSVIHQPFSSSKYLSGKTEIEPFFRTVIMAIEEAQYEIKLKKEDLRHIKNGTVAIVFFRKEMQ